MKENFPNLLQEIDMQVQESQRVPNKMDGQRLTPRHIIIKMPKIKATERILKAAKEKKLVIYRGIPISLSADFSKETAGQKGLARNIQSHEKQGPIAKIALLSKAILQH